MHLLEKSFLSYMDDMGTENTKLNKKCDLAGAKIGCPSAQWMDSVKVVLAKTYPAIVASLHPSKVRVIQIFYAHVSKIQLWSQVQVARLLLGDDGLKVVDSSFHRFHFSLTCTQVSTYRRYKFHGQSSVVWRFLVKTHRHRTNDIWASPMANSLDHLD